jgi:hypothetical protein
MLSKSAPDTHLIWALAACVAHNLLAGNCTRESLGVVLDGAAAQETGIKIARALGCGHVATEERGKQTVLGFISSSCGAHDFPSAIEFGFRSRHEVTTDWIDDPHLRHAILPLSSPTAIAVSLHQGFVRIRAHEFPFALGPLASAAGWIIPSYLEDLCRRNKLLEFRMNQSQILSVLHDMASWFERCGGNPKAVLAGEQLLVFDAETPAVAFVELVERMRSKKAGRGVTGQGADLAHSKTLDAVIEPKADVYGSEVIQVRPWVLNELLRAKRVLALRTDPIQVDLESRLALRGTVDEDEGQSWLIDADWWNQTSKKTSKVPNHVPLKQEYLVESVPFFSSSADGLARNYTTEATDKRFLNAASSVLH